jgi:hypothetical protein
MSAKPTGLWSLELRTLTARTAPRCACGQDTTEPYLLEDPEVPLPPVLRVDGKPICVACVERIAGDDKRDNMTARALYTPLRIVLNTINSRRREIYQANRATEQRAARAAHLEAERQRQEAEAEQARLAARQRERDRLTELFTEEGEQPAPSFLTRLLGRAQPAAE